MYEVVFDDVASPLALRGVGVTIPEVAPTQLPGAIADAIETCGLGTSRADLVEFDDGTCGSIAFTPTVRAADDTAKFGGHATFLVQTAT